MSASVHNQGESRTLSWILGFMLLLVPLFRASNRPLPLLALELVAVGLLIFHLYRPRPHSLPPKLHWSLLVVLSLPLLQLLPLPSSLHLLLPGHGPYLEALALVGADPNWRPLSLIPHATERAWLSLLPPVSMFLLAMTLPSERLRRLALVFVSMATAQALLGLMQVGDGADSPLRLGNQVMGDSAVGTYVNRNHLAGLLLMALPMVLGLLAAALERHATSSQPRSLRQRLASLGGQRQQRLLIYTLLALVILLGLVFTRSRAGIGLGMLGLLLTAVVFAQRLGSSRIIGLVSAVVLVGGLLMVQIGLAPVLERFAGDDPLQDERWAINAASLHTIGVFFPLGSGTGTYPDVFRQFQPDTVTGFINRAHNDFLEWISGGGIIIAGVLGLVLWEYLRRWPQLIHPQQGFEFHYLQIGAGLGLLLIGLHSLVDFNLHIPANAVYFSFLAALFWHPQPQLSRRRRRRATAPMAPAAATQEVIVNPFADP